MAKRWQYPSRVEPVFVPAGPPPVLASSWLPVPEVPQRRKANLSYTYPAAAAPDRQPVPVVSKWLNESPVPARARSRVPAEGSFFSPFPIPNPPPPINFWFAPDIAPLRAKVFRPGEASFFHPYPLPPPVSSWSAAPSEPLRRRVPLPVDTIFFHPLPIPAIAPVLVSSWYQPLPEPTRRKPVGPGESSFFAPLPLPNPPPVVTVDMWFQSTETPQSHWHPVTGVSQFSTFAGQTLIPIAPPPPTVVISEQNTYIGTAWTIWGSTTDTDIGGG